MNAPSQPGDRGWSFEGNPSNGPSRDDDFGVDIPSENDIAIRHIQPYQALKSYRCPGCNGEIPPGRGHKVVVPVLEPELRRHWHTGCWHSESRRRGAK